MELSMKVLTRLLIPVVLASSCELGVCHADEQGGAQKPDAACAACHGTGGSQPASPDIPRLAGQEQDYLAQALGQYRSGARQNPIMGAMAKSLSDTQIRALAQYFASQR